MSSSTPESSIEAKNVEWATSDGDIYGVYIEATTIDYQGDVKATSCDFESTKMSGFVAGVALVSSSSSNYDNEGFTHQVSSCTLKGDSVRGLLYSVGSSLTIAKSSDSSVTSASFTSTGTEVKGVDIQVAGAATLASDISVDGDLTCTSASGKVIGMEVVCNDATFGGDSSITWSSSATLSGLEDVDGVLISASSVSLFQSVTASVSGLLTSSSGGVVRGVVWDIDGDFTTLGSGVSISSATLTSSAVVKGWDLYCTGTWASATNSIYDMASTTLLGTDQSFGFFLIADSFSSSNTDDSAFTTNNVNINTLGDSPSAVFYFHCNTSFSAQNLDMSIESSTIIYTSSSPSLLRSVLIRAPTVNINGDLSFSISAASSNGDCTMLELLSTVETLTWSPPVTRGLITMGYSGTVSCIGDVVGIKITGEKSVSLAGNGGTEQLQISGNGALSSSSGDTIGIMVLSETEGITLSEVFFFFFFFFSFFLFFFFFFFSFFFFFFLFFPTFMRINNTIKIYLVEFLFSGYCSIHFLEPKRHWGFNLRPNLWEDNNLQQWH